MWPSRVLVHFADLPYLLVIFANTVPFLSPQKHAAINRNIWKPHMMTREHGSAGATEVHLFIFANLE
jgi:hypothetical protein